MSIKNSTLKKFSSNILACSLLCAFFILQQPAAADPAADGYKLYQQKRYREAAQAFDIALSARSNDANLCYYAAVCNQQAGNLPRAKTLYRQVTALQPGSTIASYAESVLAKLSPSSGGSASSSQGVSSGQDTPASSAQVSGPEEGSVYYRAANNSIYVNCEINNRTIEMVLDTGAPGITAGRAQLERAGIRPPDGQAVGRTGGSSNSVTQDFWVMPATVKLGPYTVANSSVKVLATNAAEPLLGQGLMQYFDYTIDQGARCIRLRKKGSRSSASKSGYSVPFEYRAAGNRIIVTVDINGKSGPMMVDTGNAASGISFHSLEQAKQYGVNPPDDAHTTVHTGVSGSGRCLDFMLNRAKLGPIEKSNFPVSIHLDTGKDTDAPLLGSQFFDGWQYNIDLQERKIWLVRR